MCSEFKFRLKNRCFITLGGIIKRRILAIPPSAVRPDMKILEKM